MELLNDRVIGGRGCPRGGSKKRRNQCGPESTPSQEWRALRAEPAVGGQGSRGTPGRRKAGAPECVKDDKGKGQAKKKVVKPPEITALGHRINHAIAEEECSPMDKEGDKMVNEDGYITFKGCDSIPEVDPKIHRAGAP